MTGFGTAADLAGDAFLGIATVSGAAAQFAPVPGLLPAIQVLASIAILCQQVGANRNGAEFLSNRCRQLLSSISITAPSWSSDQLNEAVRQAELLLAQIKDRMDIWAKTDRVKSFFRVGQISAEIKNSVASVDQLVERLQITSLMSINAWQAEFESSARKDHQEAVHYLSDISRKTDIIQLLLSQQADAQDRAEAMQLEMMGMLQTLLINAPKDTTEQEGLRQNLFQLSNFSGELLPLPDMRLQSGGEVKRTGNQPYGGGATFDIWQGQYLGNVRVDIKTMRAVHSSPKNLERFEREAKVWTALWNADRGKHIVRIFGYCMDDPYPCIVSEWQKNGRAIDYIRVDPYVDLKKLILRIAHAVRVLHSMSPPIIHGDLKGENIHINARGRPLISDFGLSKMVEEMNGAPVTQSKGVSDSCRYTACEQLMGSVHMSPATDVWAFAMTALQLLTGKHPFAEIKSNTEVVIKCYTGHRPRRPAGDEIRIKGLNDECWTLMQRCWVSEPEQRPSIEEVIYELEKNVWKGTVVD